MRKKEIILYVLVLIIITFMFSACVGAPCKNKELKNIGVTRDNPLLQYFTKLHPDNEIILCGQEDVNNDNTKDLVIIYRVSKTKNAMKIVIAKEHNYKCSNEVPAPMENQIIKFKNIDDKDQIEVIVSGSKNGQVGYAIFRLQNMKIVNLFGNDMEDCC
ncbi:Cys-Cys-COOH (seleno)protein SaoC [Clostridium sp. FP1]|uniref:Cys-Cys-COOH (seleno)protein SaoC n=1 Tax=Clostridium sp. FP1 TaxID=2724076 RepID=UPI0013E965FD|nr:Cys-Cys-COOH (seleno)protein SaoC [Clostridium sp. FP1]MBZ9633768.1 hypothetical protein [Clostridium sp. FP1]